MLIAFGMYHFFRSRSYIETRLDFACAREAVSKGHTCGGERQRDEQANRAYRAQGASMEERGKGRSVVGLNVYKQTLGGDGALAIYIYIGDSNEETAPGSSSSSLITFQHRQGWVNFEVNFEV